MVRLTSRVIIAIGIVLLAVSWAMGYTDYHLINWMTFLLGSILVIVGTGRLFFLDNS